MNRINYETMTDAELKDYFLKHRNDKSAFQAYLERINQSPKEVIINDILKTLPQLSNKERLEIDQEALRLTQQEKDNLTSEEIEQQWSVAATEALEDYTSDEELTAFNALNSEPYWKQKDGFLREMSQEIDKGICQRKISQSYSKN